MAKIILNQTVAKLGVAGDVVDVKPGYARNYLLPKSIAITWTPRAAKQAEIRRDAARRRSIKDAETAKDIKAQLEAQPLQISVMAGVNGRLFGAITATTIAKAAKDVYGVDLDKRKVEIDGVVKKTGLASAKVALHDGVIANVRLNIVASASNHKQKS